LLQEADRLEGNMSIRIIDNKKVEMTDSEWDMYNNMCRSYDRTNFKGEELFKDLFHTDDSGIIIFLKPPSTRFISMEVYLFISSVFMHQHLRQVHEHADRLFDSMNSKIVELDKLIQEKKNA